MGGEQRLRPGAGLGEDIAVEGVGVAQPGAGVELLDEEAELQPPGDAGGELDGGEVAAEDGGDALPAAGEHPAAEQHCLKPGEECFIPCKTRILIHGPSLDTRKARRSLNAHVP